MPCPEHSGFEASDEGYLTKKEKEKKESATSEFRQVWRASIPE
jgi:hypothetical protein